MAERSLEALQAELTERTVRKCERSHRRCQRVWLKQLKDDGHTHEGTVLIALIGNHCIFNDCTHCSINDRTHQVMMLQHQLIVITAIRTNNACIDEFLGSFHDLHGSSKCRRDAERVEDTLREEWWSHEQSVYYHIKFKHTTEDT